MLIRDIIDIDSTYEDFEDQMKKMIHKTNLRRTKAKRKV